MMIRTARQGLIHLLVLYVCLNVLFSVIQCDSGRRGAAELEKRSFRPHLSSEGMKEENVNFDKRVTSRGRALLLRKLLKRQVFSSASSSSVAVAGPGSGSTVSTVTYSAIGPSQNSDFTSQTTNNGTFAVYSTYGVNGTVFTGGVAQYLVIPSSSRYSVCNSAFNGSPIPWKNTIVLRSLTSFLKELERNARVLSIDQSCSLLFYWRKRMEQATTVTSCSSSDPWCTRLSTAKATSNQCTPLFCTKNPGADCNSRGALAKCKTSFPIKCVISCLKLMIKTSDPATLTNVISNLQQISGFLPFKKSAVSRLLTSRGLYPKRQAMMSNCPTCGCVDGANDCNICYSWAPTGTPCWDPDYVNDCCQCLVLS